MLGSSPRALTCATSLRARPLALVLALTLTAADARAECLDEHVRWASSSDRVYVEHGGICTLSQIDAFVSTQAEFDLVDAALQIWYIGVNLHIEDGSSLIMHGSAVGGDVNELRLQSDPGDHIEIRGQYGSVDVNSVKITSWDSASAGPDMNPLDGRAFMRVVSNFDDDGVTPLESRMSFTDSDVGYLGFYDSESYGLSWKVRGDEPGLYDKVGVYGDVVRTIIHHNYFGAYTYGGEAMQWLDNEFHHNISYGLDPHDDSDRFIVDGNYVHHNGNHGFIASQRCDNFVITNNVSEGNTGNGFMLHRATDFALVEGNLAEGNTDAGFAIFDSHDNVLRDNVSRDNLRGIRFSVGSSFNTIDNNELSDNTRYGLWFYQGSDIPSVNDGRPSSNVFTNNRILNSGEYRATTTCSTATRSWTTPRGSTSTKTIRRATCGATTRSSATVNMR